MTAIIGGGLAGMAAARVLAAAGERVLLLERRPFLGGRAFSFRDPDSGAILDNGQHVLVGACARLRAFLRAIGSPRNGFVRQARLALPVLSPGGAVGWLRAPRLPGPLHLTAALAGYRHLAAADKWTVARAIRWLSTAGTAEIADAGSVPLGAWLAGRGMPARAIERFWEPLVRPALNMSVVEADLSLAAFFLKRALRGGPSAGALWLPAAGLSEALGEPGRRAIVAAGVDVRVGARARSIVVEDGRVAGVEMAGGENLPASRVIAAVPPRDLDAILPEPLRPPRPYASIGSSAIVNVYLWYDRPVMELPFAGTFGSPLQWVFDRTRLLGTKRSGGECLGISLSAADAVLEWSKDDLAELCDEAVARVFPLRRPARRIRFAVVKEPHATFRAGPGVTALRPATAGPADGLYLAGDWTDTGWPATMEGAVRSGEAAARAALS